MNYEQKIEKAVTELFIRDRAVFRILDKLYDSIEDTILTIEFDVDLDSCRTALKLLEMPIATDTDLHDENGVYAPGIVCGDYFWDLWRSDAEDADAFLKECYRCKKSAEDELAEPKKDQQPSEEEMLNAEMKLAKIVADSGLRPPKIETTKLGHTAVSLSQGCPHCPFSEWDSDKCGACRALGIAQVPELSDCGYPACCPLLDKGILVKRETQVGFLDCK